MATKTRTPEQNLRRLERGRVSDQKKHASRTPAEKLERVWRGLARPPRPRPDSSNSSVIRKVAVARSNMPWSDQEECFRTYMAAYVLSELFGEAYVVDHFVPLTSPLVCGLHTHDNLRVVKQSLNSIKSNVYWPGMWPIDWGTIEFLEEYGQYSSN